jgi:hypothetical protein
MKNIHLLPIDKPRTYKGGKVSTFTAVSSMIPTETIYNIYITSDEQAKEGDWGYIPFEGGNVKLVGKYFADDWKKIILTTDQDLIKDGVQAIDDEFLEWFVQNPSCEMVKVEEFSVKVDLLEYKTNYKIIIPKEEKDLTYYKSNAEEDYINVPISVLRYISELEKALENIGLEEVSGSRHCQFSVVENKLAILYRNQEKILKSIKMINKL